MVEASSALPRRRVGGGTGPERARAAPLGDSAEESSLTSSFAPSAIRCRPTARTRQTSAVRGTPARFRGRTAATERCAHARLSIANPTVPSCTVPLWSRRTHPAHMHPVTQSAGVDYNWYCDLTLPAASRPNGAGDLCFLTESDCENGEGTQLPVHAPLPDLRSLRRLLAQLPASSHQVRTSAPVAGTARSTASLTTPGVPPAPLAAAPTTTGYARSSGCRARRLWGRGCIASRAPWTATGAATCVCLVPPAPFSRYPDLLGGPPPPSATSSHVRQTQCKQPAETSGILVLRVPLFTQACGEDYPCELLPSTCATGMASAGTHDVFCPLDMPNGSLPTGGGYLCYSSKARSLTGLC